MYLEYYELSEAPFSITPDPRFVFLTNQHRDALAHLLFGITQGGSGGFVQLTGEVGTGKTTLCRLLMAQVPENVRIALVLNPMQGPLEMLRTICDELRIILPKRTSSIKVLTDALTKYLLESYASGLRVVVVLDEAQNLSFETLEQVRLLTNLETPTQKLLQIILLGQPELRTLLAREELRQLAQRITARFHLAPLSERETADYIAHRLLVAGRRRPLFTPDAVREVFRSTQGYPRSINVLCDRALLGGYARECAEIGVDMVRLADREVKGNGAVASSPWRSKSLIAILLLLAITAASYQWLRQNTAATLPLAASPAPQSEQIPTVAPDSIAGFNDTVAAINSLAKTWNPSNTITSARCSSANSTLCARLRLNKFMLQELDRPVVLDLGRLNSRKMVVLRNLDKSAAAIIGNDRTAMVKLSDVEALWLGDAWIATDRPDGYTGEILAPGGQGAVVRFVNNVLARPDDISGDRSIYDAETSNRVRALQDRFGLNVDGLVGPETMALLVALAPAGPRLSDPIDAAAFVSRPQQ
jgi:general secretion pathway protein A